MLVLILRSAQAEDVPQSPARVRASRRVRTATACPHASEAGPPIRATASAPFAHPSRGKRADEEQKPDQSGEDRQYADAAHDGGLARAQPQPVVAVIRVARANADNERKMNAACVLDQHNHDPGLV